ncbi:MAG: hypothetical protein ABI091_21430 [Ferruginibacter sp.]
MRKIASLFFILFTLFYSINTMATVIITMNAPPPKEVIIIPKGHLNCVTTPAGLYNGVYVNAHKVCHYSHPSKKTIWVSGHWQCNNYRPLRALCISWIWIPSHWTATIV